jgi:hypothetical protein
MLITLYINMFISFEAICDKCGEDKWISGKDLCQICGDKHCNDCSERHSCEKCNLGLCKNCFKDHVKTCICLKKQRTK